MRNSTVFLALLVACLPPGTRAQSPTFAPVRIAPTPAPTIAPTLPDASLAVQPAARAPVLRTIPRDSRPGANAMTVDAGAGAPHQWVDVNTAPTTYGAGPIGGGSAAPVVPVPANAIGVQWPSASSVPGYAVANICLTPSGACDLPVAASLHQACYCRAADGTPVGGQTAIGAR